MSRTTEYNVLAEMLTVPAHAACSWEHEIVTGGSSWTGWAAAISCAMVQAMTVSVASGRKGPCCSKLPTGSTATRAARFRASMVVSVVVSNRSGSIMSAFPRFRRAHPSGQFHHFRYTVHRQARQG
ncbi:hypothetical protein Atai01_17740 [Amycolatopsis taiwanensis]|uniref:Uncharacterized protein n=1 Tax=Amycolatopsis taiwanensis TaxID=342230 RepID=A0A9W6R084_9PSEU|nr:hypothetical protein Atai01_17740 [Amycolatopsis taiwanensis]